MTIIVSPSTATVQLMDLLPFVLPQVPHCPEDTALFNLRWAAIEFCQKTTVWREYQGDVFTLTDTTEYEFVLSPNQRVHKLLQVFLDGQEVNVVAPEVGRSLDAREATGPYAYGMLSSFSLRPAQVPDLLVRTFSAIMPTTDATTLPADFERFYDVLANGAKARLFGMARTDWVDQLESQKMRAMFVDRMQSIARAVQRGHAKQVRSSAERFF